MHHSQWSSTPFHLYIFLPKKIIGFSLVLQLQPHPVYNSKQHSFILLLPFTRHAHRPKRRHKSNNTVTIHELTNASSWTKKDLNNRYPLTTFDPLTTLHNLKFTCSRVYIHNFRKILFLRRKKYETTYLNNCHLNLEQM